MEKPLAPRLLDRERIDQAFPLVHNMAPNLTLERWVRFARPQIVSRSSNWPRGLMTIQNATGHILGLFGFAVRNALNDGRTLHLDNVIVPDIPGRDLIWMSMIEAAEHVAQVNGCMAIRAEIADELGPSGSERTWAMSSLRTFGYAVEGLRAVKRLTGEQAAIAAAEETLDASEVDFPRRPKIVDPRAAARQD